MDAKTYADGLREFADWVEEHAEILSGSDFNSQPTVLLCRINAEEFITAAHALDVERSEVAVKSGFLDGTVADDDDRTVGKHVFKTVPLADAERQAV